MLVSVKINRFRTCQDVILTDINSAIVLLGYNGAGKTNILHAIAWAAVAGVSSSRELEQSDGDVEFIVRLGESTYTYKIVRSIEFVDSGPEKGLKSGVKELLTIQRDNQPAPVTLIERHDKQLTIAGDTQMTAPTDVGAIQAVLSFYAGDQTVKDDLNLLSQFLSGITYYPLLPITRTEKSFIYTSQEYETWKNEEHFSIRTDKELNLLLIDAWMNRRESFDEIDSLIGESGLGIVKRMKMFTYAPSSESEPNSYGFQDQTERAVQPKAMYGVRFLAIDAEPRSFGYSVSQLSMGTKRVIQLISHLLLDHISVALIEQPEDAIHPGLLRKIMALIDTYGSEFQCIMTSHSPSVFNCTSPEHVRLVAYENGKTSMHALTQDQMAQAKEYMDDQGTLSEFLEIV